MTVTTQAGETPAPQPQPQWAAVVESICCPLCEYNLRGLSEPRCPECGYRFDWDALLDPTKRLHPYLFEHHPERNVRSFVRTFLGGVTLVTEGDQTLTSTDTVSGITGRATVTVGPSP